MSLADEIREYVLVAHIKPARRWGKTTVNLTAGYVHQGMGIQGNRHPAVCGALDSQKFLDYAGVKLVKRAGPKQSSTAFWTFEV